MKKTHRSHFKIVAIAGTVAMNLSRPSSAFQQSQNQLFGGHSSRAPISLKQKNMKPRPAFYNDLFPMQQNYDMASKLQMMATPDKTENESDGNSKSNVIEFIRSSRSSMDIVDNISNNSNGNTDTNISPPQELELQVQLQTLSRILLPSLLSSLLAYILFPPLALQLSYLINDSATFAVLSVDSSQFIQNFLTVTGLTFSILVGQTYYFMYQQQEAVFVSLFGEVTEAKSLLEQVALVCQGRRDMYEMCLGAMKEYVEEDLKRGLGKDPALSLSGRPMDDPLEVIMYLTSVGIPSSIYDTVRSLRQARATRLAALQKKLPPVHLLLLWLLALIELSSFPVLGAGTQTIGGYNILTIEGVLFGIMTFGIVLTLNVVGELYVGSGGAYNVDSVLGVMVKGLDEELEVRMRDVAGMDEDGDTRGETLILGGKSLSAVEQREMERRKKMIMPSPSYYPMRYSSIFGGEDSMEANNI